jgi:predicted ester cyclase
MSGTSATSAIGTATPIEELLGRYQDKQLPRKRLVAALTAAGASAAAVAMLLNAVDHATPPTQPLASVASHNQTAATAALDPAQAHAQHVANQVAGTAAPTRAARAAAVGKIVSDYSSDAVVNDPLFGAPLVGTAAIAVHKTAEMAAISNVSLNVLSRFIVGDQLVSTWEMTGTHDGPFYRYAPTGAQLKLSGTTVQARGRDGKITNETLYYDAADMQRQLAGR